jgi:Arc/MetJ-type ribon-helix-helix transcriptional regulator
MQTDSNVALFLRVPRPMLERIDGYRRGRFATRSEAVREIFRQALGDGAGDAASKPEGEAA